MNTHLSSSVSAWWAANPKEEFANRISPQHRPLSPSAFHPDPLKLMLLNLSSAAIPQFSISVMHRVNRYKSY